MTMNFQTGDIIHVPGFPAGHIQMVYQGLGDLNHGPLEPGSHIIHAQTGDGFHIEKKSKLYEKQRAFRHRSMTGPTKVVLRRVADMIANSASYRARGIGKLIFSTAKPGKYSDRRVKKYESRIEKLLDDHKINILRASDEEWYEFLEDIEEFKVVSCVTCAEAVVLCYQLTSKLGPKVGVDLDYSIALSARGTYPSTLVKALERDARWDEVTELLLPPKPKVSSVKGSGNSGFGALPIKTVGHRN